MTIFGLKKALTMSSKIVDSLNCSYIFRNTRLKMRQISLIKNTFLQEIYNRKIYIHDYTDYRLTKETYTSTYMRAKRLNVNLLWSNHSGYTKIFCVCKIKYIEYVNNITI